jgi:hypothetical protein
LKVRFLPRSPSLNFFQIEEAEIGQCFRASLGGWTTYPQPNELGELELESTPSQNGGPRSRIAATNYIQNMGCDIRWRGRINKDLQEADYMNRGCGGRINNRKGCYRSASSHEVARLGAASRSDVWRASPLPKYGRYNPASFCVAIGRPVLRHWSLIIQQLWHDAAGHEC